MNPEDHLYGWLGSPIRWVEACAACTLAFIAIFMPITSGHITMAWVHIETIKAQHEFTQLVKLIPMPKVPDGCATSRARPAGPVSSQSPRVCPGRAGTCRRTFPMVTTASAPRSLVGERPHSPRRLCVRFGASVRCQVRR
jgi:hypothetical protein